MTKNENDKKRNTGFTLVELIVVMAIGAVILTASFSFLLFGFRNYNYSSQKADIQTDVRLASDYIISELRNSDDVSVTGALTHVLDEDTLRGKYSHIVDATFEIQSVAGTSRYLVSYVVTGDTPDLNRTYEISSTVLLNRVNHVDVADVNNASPEIYYSK